MEIRELREEYKNKLELYNNLGRSLIESIKILLKDADLKVLSVTYRVKEINSFIEKIDRKSYQEPFEEMEDICGIRIICYYQKDIIKIKEILTKELDIQESFDKESKLKYDQFGYRSHHLIAKIKKEWEKAPTFRKLSNLKCEIQIRTVLMHAWAEIEHTLAYKNDAQTPTQFRRKIHRISAKLEEADEQFEELKKESENYQNELSKKIKSPIEETELNIDTLQAFMDNNFPNRKKNIETTGKLLDQMIEYDLSLADLSKAWDRMGADIEQIEKEYWEERPLFSKWAQVGMARFLLDVYSPEFSNRQASPKKDKERYRKKYFA